MDKEKEGGVTVVQPSGASTTNASSNLGDMLDNTSTTASSPQRAFSIPSSTFATGTTVPPSQASFNQLRRGRIGGKQIPRAPSATAQAIAAAAAAQAAADAVAAEAAAEVDVAEAAAVEASVAPVEPARPAPTTSPIRGATFDPNLYDPRLEIDLLARNPATAGEEFVPAGPGSGPSAQDDDRENIAARLARGELSREDGSAPSIADSVRGLEATMQEAREQRRARKAQRAVAAQPDDVMGDELVADGGEIGVEGGDIVEDAAPAPILSPEARLDALRQSLLADRLSRTESMIRAGAPAVLRMGGTDLVDRSTTMHKRRRLAAVESSLRTMGADPSPGPEVAAQAVSLQAEQAGLREEVEMDDARARADASALEKAAADLSAAAEAITAERRAKEAAEQAVLERDGLVRQQAAKLAAQAKQIAELRAAVAEKDRANAKIGRANASLRSKLDEQRLSKRADETADGQAARAEIVAKSEEVEVLRRQLVAAGERFQTEQRNVAALKEVIKRATESADASARQAIEAANAREAAAEARAAEAIRQQEALGEQLVAAVNGRAAAVTDAMRQMRESMTRVLQESQAASEVVANDLRATFEQEVAAERARVAQLEGRIDALSQDSAELASTRVQLAAATEQLAQLQAGVARVEGERAAAVAALEERNILFGMMEAQLGSLVSGSLEAGNVRASLEAAIAENGRLRAEGENLLERYRALEAQVAAGGDPDAAVATLRAQLAAAMESNADLRQAMAILRDQLAAMTDLQTLVEGQLTAAKSNNAEYVEMVRELRGEQQVLRNDIAIYQGRMVKLVRDQQKLAPAIIQGTTSVVAELKLGLSEVSAELARVKASGGPIPPGLEAGLGMVQREIQAVLEAALQEMGGRQAAILARLSAIEASAGDDTASNLAISQLRQELREARLEDAAARQDDLDDLAGGVASLQASVQNLGPRVDAVLRDQQGLQQDALIKVQAMMDTLLSQVIGRADDTTLHLRRLQLGLVNGLAILAGHFDAVVGEAEQVLGGKLDLVLAELVRLERSMGAAPSPAAAAVAAGSPAPNPGGGGGLVAFESPEEPAPTPAALADEPAPEMALVVAEGAPDEPGEPAVAEPLALPAPAPAPAPVPEPIPDPMPPGSGGDGGGGGGGGGSPGPVPAVEPGPASTPAPAPAAPKAAPEKKKKRRKVCPKVCLRVTAEDATAEKICEVNCELAEKAYRIMATKYLKCQLKEIFRDTALYRDLAKPTKIGAFRWAYEHEPAIFRALARKAGMVTYIAAMFKEPAAGSGAAD